jgi:integrase
MGVSVKVVQERLGHSNIATTLDVYSHVTPEQDREAAEAVAAVILGNVIVNDMSTISSETAEN